MTMPAARTSQADAQRYRANYGRTCLTMTLALHLTILIKTASKPSKASVNSYFYHSAILL